MAITVEADILVRAATTSEWTTENPVLPDGIQGFEYANDGVTPVGSKIGDGTTAWLSLPYWYIGSPASKLVISVPAGSAYPMNVVLTGNFRNGFTAVSEVSTSSTESEIKNDIKIIKKYTNSGKTVINSIDIYGYTADEIVTIDDLKITLYI